MKRSVIYSICTLLFLLINGIINAQELSFPESNFFSYLKGDTLVEELLVCPTEEITYSLDVEGGTPEYTVEWDYSVSCTKISDTDFSFKSTIDTVEQINCRVIDQNSDTIFKQIYIYPKIYVEPLPEYVELQDTSIYLHQRPRNAVVEADGVYYDSLVDYYYFRPDSAGKGEHTVTISAVSVAPCLASGELDPFSIKVYDKLQITFDMFDTDGMNEFCMEWIFEEDIQRYTVTGGIPPYNVEIGRFDPYMSGMQTVPYFVTDFIGNQVNGEIEIFIEMIYVEQISDPHKFVVAGSDPFSVVYQVDSYFDYQVQWDILKDGSYTASGNDRDTDEDYEFIFDPSVYAEPGEYEIRFQFESDFGCGEDEYVMFKVVEPLEIEFDGLVDNNYFCSADEINKNYTVVGGIEPYSVTIDWGDFLEAGEYDVPYIVTDESGQEVSGSLSITIEGNAEIDFAEDYPDVLTPGEIVELFVVKTNDYDIQQLAVSTSWMGDFTIDYIENAQGLCKIMDIDEQELTDGDFFVEIEIISQAGCGNGGQSPLRYDFSKEAANDLSINFINEESFCEHDFAFAEVEVNGGTEPYTYVWNYDGISVENTQPLLYLDWMPVGIIDVVCTVTDANGYSVEAHREYEILPIPEVKLADATILAGEEYTFEPEVLNVGHVSEFEWNTGERTAAITVTDEGVYSVTVFTYEGCQNTDSAELVVEDPLLELKSVNPGKASICENSDEIAYNQIVATGGLAFYNRQYDFYINDDYIGRMDSYTLNLDRTNPVADVKVVDSLGNEVERTFSVAVSPAPDAVLEDASVLAGNSHTFVAGDAAQSYLWSNGETSPSITVSEAGEYYVEIENEFNCVTVDAAELFVESCQLSVAIEYERINDNSVRLTSSIAAETYQWEIKGVRAGNERTIDAELSAGTNVIELSVVSNGCEAADSKTVIIEAKDHFSIEGTVMTCCSYVDCGQTIAYLQVDGDFQAVDTVDIQADGTYKHENLPEGKYIVKAVPCDLSTYQPTYYVHAITPDKAAVINLIGYAFSVDIVLVPYCTLSAENSVTAGLKIYPNPMFDHARVELENADNAEMIIVDQTGRIVMTEQIEGSEARLFRSDFNTGIYSIIITADSKTIATKQLIVK